MGLLIIYFLLFLFYLVFEELNLSYNIINSDIKFIRSVNNQQIFAIMNYLILFILLAFINAFFAAAEIAYVSINKTKVNQLAADGDKKAIRVLKLLEDADDFLATIQVAITFAGFLSSAQAATSFALVFAEYLPDFPGAATLAKLVVTMILSYFTLVLGELFPKQVALQMPETIAMLTSGVVAA